MAYGNAVVDDLVYDSGQCCAQCEEDITITEDCVLLEVVLPQVQDNQVVLPPFENAVGGYAYTPYYFCSACWPDLCERVGEALEEADCQPVPTNNAFAYCALCRSGLCVGEPAARASMGMLETSRRVPNGEHAITFWRSGANELVCLSCARAINDDIIEMWPDISYSGECRRCTYQRVWRTGQVCACPPEEEEDCED